MECCHVRLKVRGDPSARLRVGKDAGIAWSSDQYIPYRVTELPDYEGGYLVIPKLAAQTLPTTDRVMRDDLTVDGIPSYRTTNIGGGYTVVIAQD